MSLFRKVEQNISFPCNFSRAYKMQANQIQAEHARFADYHDLYTTSASNRKEQLLGEVEHSIPPHHR